MMPINIRDNVHKHKKEKDIDNFLLKKETKRAIELKAQVKEMEKVAEIKLKQKRMRDFEVKSEKNISKENDGIKESEEKQEINIKDAVEKILRHIEKPTAFGKCLNLLKSIFLNIQNIQPLVIIKIFFKILNLPFKFTDPLHRNSLKELFEYTINEFSRINRENQKFYFDLLKVFYLALDIELNLITDDSFKFNAALKNLDREFDSIQPYDESEDKELKFFINSLMCLNKQTEEATYNIDPYDESLLDESNLNIDKEILLIGIRRWLISDCFKESFKLNSFKWALPSINNIFKKAYLDKDKHSPQQLEQLETMVNTLKNKNASISNLNNSRALIDHKIKDNPLEAYHKVSDARDEKIVEYSIDKWQAKQAGLTYGRLFMNN